MPTRIQIRRGTSAQWAATNPVLAAGEEGLNTDTGERRMGDGATVWASLPNGPTNKVDKGTIAYVVSDYASLSAAIAAAPAGGAVLAPAGTYTPVAITKTLTLLGHGPHSTIVDAAAVANGFSFPGAGSAFLEFRDMAFTGSTSSIFELASATHLAVKFVNCRFYGFASGIAVNSYGVDLTLIDCEFDGLGTGLGTGVSVSYGGTLTARGCRFRGLNRGIYVTSTNGYAARVDVQDCTFDGQWMYLKASKASTVSTYTTTTVTDSGGGLGSVAAGSTVRAMPVRQTGTITSAQSGAVVNDTAASFIVAGVRKGDILRTATQWGVVSEVLSATAVQLDSWLTLADYQPAPNPATSTAYTIFGLLLGKVVSATSTVLTVNAWADWDGGLVTPPAGARYEVAPVAGYQGLFAQEARQVRVSNNLFRRSWADQIGLQKCSGVVVTGNHVEDGQDVGITVDDATVSGTTRGAIISGNRVKHQGTAGIFAGNADRCVIDGNTIENANWLQLGASATTGYGAINVQSCTDGIVSHNQITRLGHPGDYKGIRVAGTADRLLLDGNRSYGYVPAGRPDLVIDGTGLTNINGNFQPDIALTLTGSAFCPRGNFSGTGAPAVSAATGSTYRRDDGGAGTSFYVKESSTAALNWVAK